MIHAYLQHEAINSLQRPSVFLLYMNMWMFDVSQVNGIGTYNTITACEKTSFLWPPHNLLTCKTKLHIII